MNIICNLCVPLTLIKVSLEHLYEKPSPELVNNVLQQIRGINNLLTDLESISRTSVSPGCLSLTDHKLSMFLKEMVNRLSGYANKRCITLHWVDESAFVTVCLDKEKMAAILRNLLMVSTDSIDRGGEISLSTLCNTQNQELRLEPEDNGPLKKKL